MAESKVDLASLSLFRGTPAQVEESRRRTFPQWGGTLSLTDYLARDVTMESGEHAKDGKLITWVLAPRDDPTTLDFISTCETYKRTGLVHEANCYGVACVFTPPSKRGRGYASHMMSLLHWVTASRANLPKFPEAWGAPPEEVADAGKGLFSVLYSDIGEEFYRSAGPGGKGGGWEKRSEISTIWEVGTEEGDDEGWKWLTEEQLNELWEPPRRHSRHTCQRMVSADSTSQSGFWGVESTRDPGTYASWSVDLRPPPTTLIVTRLCASEEMFPGLIVKIKQAARRSGIEKVEVWNLRVGLKEVAEKTGGRTFMRNEHLPQIVWYGPEITGNVEWAYNEKFCWC
ncbi:uncharacterized protein EDB93DRAFT_1240282 [Suillus bovinus]|uniref:uncharacterized protein n=1 Tax=Suillus bovinus TaxID=48563 RepID=UPI001B8667CF|nr:uncharacterized protein EDB93DRAFT_1240282 [Suillus bovinus]KAG2150248.1 hypothetical protein EDB93DRAFT_1240282 [Suillus bovinus]